MSKGQFSQRRDGRIVALLYLYRWGSSSQAELDTDLRDFFHELAQGAIVGVADDDAAFLQRLAKPRDQFAFGEELIHAAIEHMAEIDSHIKGLAHNWEFERIARIDLAILRLAICEMLYRNDIPPVVSINEAIDLSKQFSNMDSKRFINGILDRLKDKLGRDSRKPTTD